MQLTYVHPFTQQKAGLLNINKYKQYKKRKFLIFFLFVFIYIWEFAEHSINEIVNIYAGEQLY